MAHSLELELEPDQDLSDIVEWVAFNIGDHVDVQAISKGHGFTGAIKR